MIEIIEKGTKAVTKCPACGCKFSYEEEDVKIKYNKQYPLDKPTGAYVCCPQCNHELSLCLTR